MMRLMTILLPMALIGAAGVTSPAQAGFKAVDYVRLAQKAYSKGQYGRARSYSKRAIRGTDNPTLLAAAYTTLCRIDMTDQPARAATDSCEQALQAQPDNWRMHFNRGLAFLKAGQRDEALADFNQAMALGADRTMLAEHMDEARQLATN